MATTTRRTRATAATPSEPSTPEPTGSERALARRARKTAATTMSAATDLTATDPAAAEPMAADPSGADPARLAGGAVGDPSSEDARAVAPVSAISTSPAPVGSGDHMKIVMVAGILGDHPDGVSAASVAGESGLRAGIVARVLAAMELAGAAVRKTAADGEADVWLRGEADLTTVDLARADEPETCPTCHRRMPRRSSVPVRRGLIAPGQNGDGQATLAKNGLRDLVRALLAEHPRHEFTAGTIARELGRSSGAVGNALARLTATGEAVLVKDTPMTYAVGATPTSTTKDRAATAQAEAPGA